MPQTLTAYSQPHQLPGQKIHEPADLCRAPQVAMQQDPKRRRFFYRPEQYLPGFGQLGPGAGHHQRIARLPPVGTIHVRYLSPVAHTWTKSGHIESSARITQDSGDSLSDIWALTLKLASAMDSHLVFDGAQVEVTDAPT